MPQNPILIIKAPMLSIKPCPKLNAPQQRIRNKGGHTSMYRFKRNL